MRAISKRLFIYENMAKSHPITIALSLFLIFASVFLWIARYWKENDWNDPFSIYFQNLGILVLFWLSVVVSIFIPILIAIRNRMNFPKFTLQVFIIVAAILPWTEMYWGSTFYYGEIRDKSGLPLNTIFFGPIGSGFALFALFTEGFWKEKALRLKFIFFIFVVIFEFLLWFILRHPWNMIQS
ncbi:hypothetical protein LEP1GSC132_2080 [Leptospira kirschneri str. 200803703]|uniref:Uncharacterized protein n=2 Tax=Leptospira TaxID=171 RepID=A0AAE9GJ14_9LEPT|nr:MULTISPECIES: hypothetical protein [Leptospira]EKO52314.1 hypothetical protein LEP1GSC131_3584 [Leptospira kirschneri str. 200802841]EKR75230.1 hypothetical protein LEP1GSC041_2279 [Leptospira noguchii str. 2006001870]EMO65570.1 hypothetical protein LEP1GSC132_2080 [Leptospira kirschneri str. 200803703]UOG58224.1 hypothetical protein MAL03_02015 [Leptospira noguchii]